MTVEYDVRAPETGGTAELVTTLNSQAEKGWRLVSTAAGTVGISTRVYMFFEREKPERT